MNMKQGSSAQKDCFLERRPLAVVSLLAIPLFFLGALFFMQMAGVQARKFIPIKDRSVIEITVIRSNVELYRYWNRMGIKGRIVAHAGRYLHYVNDKDGSSGYRATRTYPVTVHSVKDKFENNVNYANFLWVAVQANMARSLYMLMPADVFSSRFNSDADYPESRQGIVRDHDFGTPRIILNTVPALKEQVVLNIDASYLSSPNGRDVLDKLAGNVLDADVITFCLSEDNPDVTEVERIQAMQLLEGFAAASKGKIRLLKKS